MSALDSWWKEGSGVSEEGSADCQPVHGHVSADPALRGTAQPLSVFLREGQWSGEHRPNILNGKSRQL